MAILIQDSFTGADGTPINAHAPEIGGTWTAGSTPPTLQSGRCKNSVTGTKSFGNPTNATTMNRYAQAKIYGLGTVTLILFSDTVNDYLSLTATTLYLNASSIGFTYTPGATYRIERIGSTVYAYENGVQKLSAVAVGATSAQYPYGVEFIGINAAIDDYESGTMPTPPTAPSLLTAACVTGIGESLLPDVPRSSFTADVLSGLAPLTVQFTDGSTNTPTSWLWEDETGTFSTSQNPLRIFAEGIHTVRLTATNAQGTGHPYQMTIIATETPVVVPPEGGTITPGGAFPGATLQGLFGRIGYYAVDTEGNQIKIHGHDGTQLKTFGGVGTAVGKFFRPTTCSVMGGRQLLDRIVIPEEE